MGEKKSWSGARVFTIGHSTRSLADLVFVLQSFGVTTLVDIRTIPRSRHNPQFDASTLPAALRGRGVRYCHLPRLGGLRRPRRDSPNAGWHNAGFRGFADYALTDEFESGLEELRGMLSSGPIAVMCAEAVPWRCHRSLLADALAARGARVEHITGPRHASPHHLTPFARIEGNRVTYPDDGAGEVLAAKPPFHLEATVRVLQRRPTNAVDTWDGAHYRRVLEAAGRPILAEVMDRGAIDAPDLRLTVEGDEDSGAGRDAVKAIVRRALGMEVDPEPLDRLALAEPRLASVAVGLRGMRPPRFAGLFEAFANVVPFQQVSLDAGVAVVTRLVERFGRPLERDGHRFFAFPSSAVIAGARPEALRACGMSLRKATTLRRIAEAIEAGALSEAELSRMGSPEAIRLLTELDGIGPWSATLVLLRGLGRLDVFPPGDVGVARGLARLADLNSERAIKQLVKRFGDRRGYLYFIALAGSLISKGLIHPAPALGRG